MKQILYTVVGLIFSLSAYSNNKCSVNNKDKFCVVGSYSIAIREGNSSIELKPHEAVLISGSNNLSKVQLEDPSKVNKDHILQIPELLKNDPASSKYFISNRLGSQQAPLCFIVNSGLTFRGLKWSSGQVLKTGVTANNQQTAPYNSLNTFVWLNMGSLSIYCFTDKSAEEVDFNDIQKYLVLFDIK